MAQSISSESSSALRDAVRRILRPTYLNCLKDNYSIRADSPLASPLIGLSESQEAAILDNLVYGAETLGFSAEVVTEKSIAKFFANKGKDDFLKRAKHPLARFAEDVGLIVCNLISFEEHKRKHNVTEEPARAAVERIEHRPTLRDDVRQSTVEGAVNILSALGVKRPQRLDFKLAANA